MANPDFVRWSVGLFVALVGGWAVASLFLRVVRKHIGYVRPPYKHVPPWILGIAEGVFFTVAVAFDLSGLVTGMVGWIAVKMAAHWGTKTEKDQPNIEAVRFSALLGSMISLFFAMVGGLICAGKLSV